MADSPVIDNNGNSVGGSSFWGDRTGEMSVATLLSDLRSGAREPLAISVAPTGFGMLDRALEGGIHVGDLVVLAGMPGVGKTIAALQWARHLAAQGNQVLYLCYEHDVDTLLARLVSCEIGELGLSMDQPTMAATRGAVRALMARDGQHRDLDHPVVRAALAGVDAYADRLVLEHVASGTADLAHISDRVKNANRPFDVVVVDYLQKVPAPLGQAPNERLGHTVQGLKDLAIAQSCAVVGLSAVNVGAVGTGRLRLDGLLGAAVVGHEADLVITMNPKLSVVSKNHLAFDPTRYEEFSKAVVFTIEKNRRGLAPLDLEFDKDFENYRFCSTGRFVAERLVDGSRTLE